MRGFSFPLLLASLTTAMLLPVCVAGESVHAPRGERMHLETSPYLRRHADNLVEWWAWGEGAIEEAKKLDRPVFLTSGFFTSSWCQRMEQESFMDPDTASYLNRNFVCVLVDREERPALDAACLRYLMFIGEPPAWPLHVILTPNRLPIYGSSYLPAADERDDGQNLMKVLEHVAGMWKNDVTGHLVTQSVRDNDQARSMLEAVPPVPEGIPRLKREDLGKIVEDTLRAFDPVWGGATVAPKFPYAPSLQWLLAYSEGLSGDPVSEQARAMVWTTLRGMAAGAIRDHVGGGFHRYALDDAWRVPSFEKMLYDQALLGELYAQAYALTSEPLYKEVALATFGYMEDRLRNPEGGYFSSESASSAADSTVLSNDAHAGTFFAWSEGEFNDVFAEEADSTSRELLHHVFGIRPHGNIPPGYENSPYLSQRNLIFQVMSVEEAAGLRKIGSKAARSLYDQGIRALASRRDLRPRPWLDRKVLADWNGLAIAALARSSKLLSEPPLLENALATAGFIFEKMVDPVSLAVSRSHVRGKSAVAGVCGDYAALTAGCLALYDATAEEIWLERAIILQNVQMERFMDGEYGGFYDVPVERADLFFRLKQAEDADVPSPNALNALNLVQLSRIAEIADSEGAAAYGAAAARLFAVYQGKMLVSPGTCPGLLMAFELFTRDQ